VGPIGDTYEESHADRLDDEMLAAALRRAAAQACVQHLAGLGPGRHCAIRLATSCRTLYQTIAMRSGLIH